MAALMEERLFTVAEIARKLRVSRMTVYRMIERRDIVGIRVGRSLRVPEKSIITYLRASIQ